MKSSKATCSVEYFEADTNIKLLEYMVEWLKEKEEIDVWNINFDDLESVDFHSGAYTGRIYYDGKWIL
jgi:hypothetical protein